MTTRIEANAAIKAEMKSFEMCITMLISMASLPDVKKYLSKAFDDVVEHLNKYNKENDDDDRWAYVHEFDTEVSL